MKSATVFAAIAGAALLGAVGVADTAPRAPVAPAFGELAETLAIDDVWVDAERVFAKVDVDRNGEIDVDEYAAQAVVFAGLVRFNGVVAVDGRQTLHIGLPTTAEASLGAAERTAIDAVARADYYAVTADGPITSRRWVELRMAAFDAADRNEDGVLTGRELSRFAMALARYDDEDDRWI